MKAKNPRYLLTAIVVGVLCVKLEAAKMHDLPVKVEAVNTAVAAENLRAVAEKTDDPDVLLGLAYLVRPGDPLRDQIGQRAAAIQPDYAPLAAVLAVLMDGADEASVKQLMERDPENALGYYMQANLHYAAHREPEAMEAYRKAAAWKELRLYENQTSAALFKALDTLNLEGRDRLCAVSWMATRFTNSGIGQIQPLHNNLGELARHADLKQREQIADMLLILAGHLYRTNYFYRTWSERALPEAFRLKAEIAAAAEDSPRMYGYTAVTQALVSTMYGWPQIAEQQDLRLVVPFVASRIYHAFLIIEPETGQEKLQLQGEAREKLKRARQDEEEAATALIEAAKDNPDETAGAYIRGLIVRDEKARPWVSTSTYVERAMARHPAVFKAALRFEEAMDALHALRREDPRQQNLSHMMNVVGEIMAYAFKHQNQLPQSLDVLVAEKLLDANDVNSRVTGRPYVYVGADQKLPERRDERFGFILLYDDHEVDGKLQAVLAIPGGFELAADELKKRLATQKK